MFYGLLFTVTKIFLCFSFLIISTSFSTFHHMRDCMNLPQFSLPFKELVVFDCIIVINCIKDVRFFLEISGLSVCAFPGLFSFLQTFCNTETAVSMHIFLFPLQFSYIYVCVYECEYIDIHTKYFWKMSHKNVFILCYFWRISRSAIKLKSIDGLIPLYNWVSYL